MAENLRKVRNCTYLFTTATITVFSEEFTALIDLNVNRGSLLASQQTSGKKPWHQINDFFFFFFKFYTLWFSQAGRVQWWSSASSPRPLKECCVQGHSSACGFPQPAVIKASLVPRLSWCVYVKHMDWPKMNRVNIHTGQGKMNVCKCVFGLSTS